MRRALNEIPSFMFPENKVIVSEEVEAVMKKVDRGNYVSIDSYTDFPQIIGYGVTISAPHMVNLLSRNFIQDLLYRLILTFFSACLRFGIA